MNNGTLFTLYPGTTPLLVSVPHAGRRIPPALQGRLVPRALDVEDTDWHLEQLYDFVRGMGAGLIVPQHSRYVVDLNRPPENTPMYAGSNNTELCPTRFFTGDPLYREGQAPDEAEITQRVQTWWRPYHDALRRELDRLRAAHGHAVLFDGHSIKSQLPWLFEGKLPDLNLGTANGAACDPGLQHVLGEVLAAPGPFTHAINGRFKGGHITRHYGQPAQGFHAVQLEMCWSTYMQETAPYTLDPQRVAQITPVLRNLVQAMLDWKPHA